MKSDAARPVVVDEGDAGFSCEDQADGEACGENRHCIAGRCLINICGDGVLDGSEQCDDGNQDVDDGCTPSCRLPGGTCGDAKVDGLEECDDGNTDDNDFCSNKCVRQLCRNGVLDLNEECDDGNTDPRDGCNNSCHRVVCGDGKAEEQEECDDGNKREDDACSNLCTTIMCGNNRIDTGEACDGRIVKAASGKPEGEPIAEGLNCAEDCKSVVDDRCQKCQEANCHTWLDTVFGQGDDVVAQCYTTGTMIAFDAVSDAAFVTKCSALMECIRRNRCDLYDAWSESKPTHDVSMDIWGDGDGQNFGTFMGCFCGEVAPGSGTFDLDISRCRTAPAGRCVQQMYDASSCTTGGCVEATATTPGTPAVVAYFLSMCQRDRCFHECR
jgi:cysteine-rich repeat protein